MNKEFFVAIAEYNTEKRKSDHLREDLKNLTTKYMERGNLLREANILIAKGSKLLEEGSKLLEETDLSLRQEIAHHSRTKIKAHGMHEQNVILRKKKLSLENELLRLRPDPNTAIREEET